MKRMQILMVVAVSVMVWLPLVHADKININTASASELEQLPNVGEGLARVIVNYRETHGPFSGIESIMNVPRIGTKTFNAFKDLITVGTQAPAQSASQSGTTGLEPIEKYPTVTPTPAPSIEEIMQQFAHEPTIQDVQKAAIEYAQIDPTLFRMWRENAKKKALLPESLQVTVGHDTDDDTYYTRSKTISLSGGSATIGPDDETWNHSTDDDYDYELKLKWNLQDYMFNTDMLKASSETEDQIGLRQDILNDVTKLYFDRRRLQVEMLLDTHVDIKQKLKRSLRLEELTAIIDGMTGGYFTRVLNEADTGK